ncbi:MAG: fibronectin type III domain-containing protein [Phycisphaerales bacterium]|nr:MAG: fibronectin type III domain-containing protein [Phycisphaerales bacterium]
MNFRPMRLIHVGLTFCLGSLSMLSLGAEPTFKMRADQKPIAAPGEARPASDLPTSGTVGRRAAAQALHAPTIFQAGSRACGPDCDYCHCGTNFEENCPDDWAYDLDCDCGCQFCDDMCPDCSGQGCDCTAVCGNGVCECACEETTATCPQDCIAPCYDQAPVAISSGQKYGVNGEMCVVTYVGCNPCTDQCDYCMLGTSAFCACPNDWNGDGACDCGCQFNDIDCSYPQPCDPCTPTPGPAEICAEVLPSDCGAPACFVPPTCTSTDPICAVSVLEPLTGEYVFCPTYTAGACEGDVCVRVWMNTPDPCDPELWFRFDQIGDHEPPVPDPMSFSVLPRPISDSAIEMTATGATDSSPNVQYQFDFVSGGVGGTDSAWQTSRTYVDSGLAPDTRYCYTVRARDGASPPNVTAPSPVACAYTHAAVPTGVTFGAVDCSSMDIDIAADDNPAHTLYAIQCVFTSDSNWNGKFVSGEGRPVSSPDWRNRVQWDATRAVEMQSKTSYAFWVVARSQGGNVTAPGPAGSRSTGGCGDMDEDGDVDLRDLALWQPCFDPTGVKPGCGDGDLDGDGTISLRDVPRLIEILKGPQ